MPRKRVRKAARQPAVEAPRAEPDEAVEGRPESGDLRLLARVFALRFVRGVMNSQQKVAFLVGSGFSQAEVAGMLLMNPTTVRTALHKIRNK